MTVGECQQTPILLPLQGYGITLGTINALSVLASVLQAIPNLPLQVCSHSRRPTSVSWILAIICSGAR